MGDVSHQLISKFIKELPQSYEDRKALMEYFDIWDTDPRITNAIGRPIFSVWLHVTNPTAMFLVHTVFMIFVVLFTFGCWTRVSCFIVWFGALNYIHRSQQMLFGIDTMQTVLMTYLLLGDCGQSLSIDRLRARFRASKALLNSPQNKLPWAEAVLSGPSPSWTANFGIRLFQINFCFIYASAGFSKLKGTTWWDHKAAWYTISNPEFSPLNLKIYEDLLRLLVSERWLGEFLFAAITMFTFSVEIGFPFLVWTRLRPFWVMGSILLHTGISVIMGLTCFGLYMMAMVCSFLPAALIREKITWKKGTGTRLRLNFNSEDKSQHRLVAMLQAFDIANQITWNDSSQHQSVSLQNLNATTESSKPVLKTAFDHLVLLKSVNLLYAIPFLSKGIERIFGYR